MESLHAPWRIEYILAPKLPADQSLFTRIAQSDDDAKNLVICRERSCYALLNRYPYNGGHLMVVPYKQSPDFDGLTDDDLRVIHREVIRLEQVAQGLLDFAQGHLKKPLLRGSSMELLAGLRRACLPERDSAQRASGRSAQPRSPDNPLRPGLARRPGLS